MNSLPDREKRTQNETLVHSLKDPVKTNFFAQIIYTACLNSNKLKSELSLLNIH
jgi:hypothetical protein